MKTLVVWPINRTASEFNGYQARELHAEVAGRPPLWNTRTGRWVSTPARVADVVALAESRNYVVSVEESEAEGGGVDGAA